MDGHVWHRLPEISAKRVLAAFGLCTCAGVGARIAIIGMFPSAFGCSWARNKSSPYELKAHRANGPNPGFLSSSIFMVTGAIDIWRSPEPL